MSYKFEVGDRVWYRAYCGSREYDVITDSAGTVVDRYPGHKLDWTRGRTVYRVYWDHVDRDRYPASIYLASDLEPTGRCYPLARVKP